MLGALLMIAAATQGAHAESPADIAAGLSGATTYNASATYEVLLPQSEDPVVYTIDLYAAAPLSADTLSPCNYLIDWSLNTPSGPSTGFSAYFGGHHYRQRDKRLQEYHYTDNPGPFAPQGSVSAGVQQQAQFASLLPAFIARELVEMSTSPHYSCTVEPGRDGATVTVKGTEHYNGVPGREFEYVFDASTSLPLKAEICYNPGHMSEQTVTVRYAPASERAFSGTLDEPALIARYPEAFSTFRRSDYTLASLPGRPLPAISATTIDGRRYTRTAGEPWEMPAVIALVDADVDGCAETVQQLRDAIDASPAAACLVLAFTGTHPEAAATIAGTQRADEVVLTSARSIARDCGATATPTIIICGTDGFVKNVHTGRNKQLAEIVIQEIAIAK